MIRQITISDFRCINRTSRLIHVRRLYANEHQQVSIPLARLLSNRTSATLSARPVVHPAALSSCPFQLPFPVALSSCPFQLVVTQAVQLTLQPAQQPSWTRAARVGPRGADALQVPAHAAPVIHCRLLREMPLRDTTAACGQRERCGGFNQKTEKNSVFPLAAERKCSAGIRDSLPPAARNAAS